MSKWLIEHCWFICLAVHVFPVETITKVNGTDIPHPIQSPSLHDLQIYGIVVTIILCFIVFGGVKMINRVAPAFLIPVLFSLLCIFIGIFLTKKDYPAGECLVLYRSFFFFFFFFQNMVSLPAMLSYYLLSPLGVMLWALKSERSLALEWCILVHVPKSMTLLFGLNTFLVFF